MKLGLLIMFCLFSDKIYYYYYYYYYCTRLMASFPGQPCKGKPVWI